LPELEEELLDELDEELLDEELLEDELPELVDDVVAPPQANKIRQMLQEIIALRGARKINWSGLADIVISLR
jgi:protein involved in temperature-dependent protein secretion